MRQLLVVFLSFFGAVGSDETPAGHLEPLGFHRAPEGLVDSVNTIPSAVEFYEKFVVLSKPVIFKGAAKRSRGFHLWTDQFLKQTYGDVVVRVDYGKKENRARPADNLALEEFLDVYNTSDHYLVDTLPTPLWGDFSLPSCLLCGGFTNGLQDAVLWFSSGGTKSFLHVDSVENINCLMSGQKDWFFVDVEHSKQIVFDHGEGEYCSVDVDRVDMFKYPSLQFIPWWSAHMDAGDCMYIPYGWAHQVRSHSRNIAVNIWWAPMPSFNRTDCQEMESSKTGEASLDNFKFTIGQLLRFQLLQVINQHGGSVAFDQIHPLIVSEHTGERLLPKERFDLLDTNHDDILTVKEVTSQPAKVIEEALGGTHPGEVNIRGQSVERDERLVQLLERASPHQPPEVEEFLLREHKSDQEIAAFRKKHWHNLPRELQDYLQDKLPERQAGDREEL